MPTTSWNDAENKALRRLPLRARVAYLQGIRRNMDYRTGVAGRARILSYQFFTELLQAGDRTTAPDPIVTKRGLQTIFLMLERVGLVEWIRGTPEQRGVVFRCLLADTDQSVQNQAVPKRDPSGTQEAGPSQSSHSKGSNNGAGPKRDPSGNDQAVPPPDIRISGKEKNGAIAPSCDASRFGEFWDAWPAAMRKRNRAKAEEIWNRRKLDAHADMIIADVQKRAEQDQQWLRGYAPMPTTYLNGKRWEDELGGPTPSGKGSGNGATSLEERNRTAIAQWLASGTGDGIGDYIEGEFSHERH
jgi:hypothetical protein